MGRIEAESGGILSRPERRVDDTGNRKIVGTAGNGARGVGKDILGKKAELLDDQIVFGDGEFAGSFKKVAGVVLNKSLELQVGKKDVLELRRNGKAGDGSLGGD